MSQADKNVLFEKFKTLETKSGASKPKRKKRQPRKGKRVRTDYMSESNDDSGSGSESSSDFPPVRRTIIPTVKMSFSSSPEENVNSYDGVGSKVNEDETRDENSTP